ncbi:MAG: hypothetical protein ICV67_02690 [Thermoleophilia bacterium]|nr:hypothetical protein [Thermoleophilia bacterium]
MATTRVEIEDIESTKSEKFLAVVLAAFLLVGGIWFYAKSDDWVRDAIDVPAATSAEQAALEASEAAFSALNAAQERHAQTLNELELAREAYRTALDAGRRAPALEREYERARARLRAAEREEERAFGAWQATQAAANEAAQQHGERVRAAQDRRAWVAALIRLGFVALWLLASFRLLSVLRGRDSRYLPLAFAAIGTAALLALVFAGDYVTDYVDPLDLGPLLLSLVGAAATLVAFAALQRYLARRVPVRRVRKAECPFCGYPVRGAGPHCEGCGREVVGECSTCGRPRRVGTARCSACGSP